VSEGDGLVLRGGSERAAGATVCVGMAMLAVPAMFGAGGIPSLIIGSILILVLGTCCVRWLRVEVRAEEDWLILRGGPFRSRRLSWQDVAGAKVVPAGPVPLFAILQVTGRNGRRIKLDGTGYWMPFRHVADLPVGLMAAEINRRAGR